MSDTRQTRTGNVFSFGPFVGSGQSLLLEHLLTKDNVTNSRLASNKGAKGTGLHKKRCSIEQRAFGAEETNSRTCIQIARSGAKSGHLTSIIGINALTRRQYRKKKKQKDQNRPHGDKKK